MRSQQRQQHRQQVFFVIALAVAVHLMIICVSGLRFSSIGSRWLLQYNPPPSPPLASHSSQHYDRQPRHKHFHSAGSRTVLFQAQQSLEFSNDKNSKRKAPPEAFEYTLRQDDAQDDGQQQEDDDPLRWERLYRQGGQTQSSSKARIMSASKTTSQSSAASIVSQVRVVSFDLDNTLWDTMATIDAANDALAEFLDQHNVVQPEGQRVETIMGRFFQANKTRYCPELLQHDSSNSHNKAAPVLLTLLRKDVVQHILQEHNGYTMESAMEMADRAFSTWMNARHAAIDASLAKNVPQTLMAIIQDLKQQPPVFSSHQRVVVGAITDGNSNPKQVQQLAPFFDFVINAEQVGVAKPNRQIYLHAVRHVLQYHPHVFSSLSSPQQENKHSMDPEDAAAATTSTLSDEDIEKLIGPWWVHVGDDFVKDIVAAKTLNMRSIWSRELVLQRDTMNGTTPGKDTEQPQKPQSQSTASRIVPAATLQPPPLLKQQEDESRPSIQPKDDIRPNKFVMQVGSKDYLATCLQEEFADAIVDRFVDVRTVLLDWHLDGIQKMRFQNRNDAPPMKRQTNNNDQSASASQTNVVGVETASATSTKFCIFCGEKLPLVANFCSACGQKQQ